MSNDINIQMQIMQDNLCDLRKIAGWTAEILAGKLGITKQTISNIETQKVRLSRIQYIALRAVFECETAARRDNTVLRKVMGILFGDVQNYLAHQEEIRIVMTAIASIAAAGVSGIRLHSSAVALLAPLGHIASIQNVYHGNEPSLLWLLDALENSSALEIPEINEEEEQANEKSRDNLQPL